MPGVRGVEFTFASEILHRMFSYFTHGLEFINQKVYNKKCSDGGAW